MKINLLCEAKPVQLLKNFSIFYGTPKIRYRVHWSLLWRRLIQSAPPDPIYLKSVSILYSHLYLVLVSGYFLLNFPPQFNKHYFYSFCAICPVHLIFLEYIFLAVPVLKLIIMHLSSVTYYLIPLWSKYSPQNTVSKHPHPRPPLNVRY
jgi:hypothetical protein